MKIFYVLWDGSHYLQGDHQYGPPHSYAENLGEAMPFESLCQAHEFLDSSGLSLSILRVEITSVYTPNLLNSTT